MTKGHARKREVRRRMKEEGQSYQATLREQLQDGSDASPDLPNADSREDYIDAVWDADLPQMVKVLLYELASRLDLTVPDWRTNSHHVRFEEEELARAVGLDVEAANLCRDLALEANWLVEVDEEMVELREPHQDWDLFAGALRDHKEPIVDRVVYRSRLAAFDSETKRLRTDPIMSIRRLRAGMAAVIGHTFVPKCVGGPFTQDTVGLGSGQCSDQP
ncbi:hypothetical protein [Streptomyces sp. S063]|uniref:hypothetical protein n=2 Tax=unclassified Streptomyces TaxID=2593676 RepID=UPI0013E31D94|nr:hypothetical protein [Streptomyces sp. S063]